MAGARALGPEVGSLVTQLESREIARRARAAEPEARGDARERAAVRGEEHHGGRGRARIAEHLAELLGEPVDAVLGRRDGVLARDDVGLVDHEQRGARAHERVADVGVLLVEEQVRRRVHDGLLAARAQLVHERLEAIGAMLVVLERVEIDDAHAARFEHRDLVRDDGARRLQHERAALVALRGDERGQLEHEALARGGRRGDDHVGPGERRARGRALQRPEARSLGRDELAQRVVQALIVRALAGGARVVAVVAAVDAPPARVVGRRRADDARRGGYAVLGHLLRHRAEQALRRGLIARLVRLIRARAEAVRLARELGARGGVASELVAPCAITGDPLRRARRRRRGLVVALPARVLLVLFLPFRLVVVVLLLLLLAVLLLIVVLLRWTPHQTRASEPRAPHARANGRGARGAIGDPRDRLARQP